jgi:hypothetical protein
MSEKQKEMSVIRYGVMGLFAGLISIIMDVVCGIFLNESFVFEFVNYVVLFFGKPLLFLFPEEQITNSIFEGVVMLFISALLGGLVYGIIIGLIIKGVSVVKKQARRAGS